MPKNIILSFSGLIAYAVNETASIITQMTMGCINDNFQCLCQPRHPGGGSVPHHAPPAAFRAAPRPVSPQFSLRRHRPPGAGWRAADPPGGTGSVAGHPGAALRDRKSVV